MSCSVGKNIWYSWNIAESGVFKQQKSNQIINYLLFFYMITNNHHLKIKCNVDENAFDYVVVMPLNNVQIAKISIMTSVSFDAMHNIVCDHWWL
jgi:hypothetical protein